MRAKQVQQDIRQQETIVADTNEQLLELQRRLKSLEEQVDEQGKALRDSSEDGLREHSNELVKQRHVHETHAREHKKRVDDLETEQQASHRKLLEAEEQVRQLQLSCEQLAQVRRE